MKKIKKARNFKPVSINGTTYPALYNGRRVLIVDATADPNFGLDHALVIWDKSMQYIMGWADQNSDGTFKGFVIYGPHEIPISGDDLSALAADCLSQHLWTLRN